MREEKRKKEEAELTNLDEETTKFLEEQWMIYDCDDNGFIEKTESKKFIEALLKRNDPTIVVTQQMQDKLFQEIAQGDNDGKISKLEVVRYLNK